MTDVYNFDFFQIPAAGIHETYTGDGQQQFRDFGGVMSNFGALNYGLRSDVDYTRTTLGFKNKDELQNPNVPPFAMEGDYNENPFVWGTTVKRTRNDELTIMLLGSRRDKDPEQPSFDVSSTNVSAGPYEAPKKYPSEGWRTFGGRTGGPFGYEA